MKLMRALFWMPKWNFFQIKNKHLIIFVILFGISWWFHETLFLRAFNFDTKFFPTFAMGMLTSYIVLTVFKKEKKEKIMV